MKLNYLFSTFTYSTSIELLVTELEKSGVASEQILAVPLERYDDNQSVFDTDFSDDGKSLLDLAGVFGAIFMLLGVIYGLVFYWGPVIWGLMGLVFGLAFGFSIEFFYKKKGASKRMGKAEKEFVIIIHIEDFLAEQAVNIMNSHGAKGIGRIER
ncbi:hypothetical protein ACQCVE_10650 [Metabacillus sp. 113a]|uniref:hypothetical protein n=1 Tax=Metabacillus sp. 113a TaxID=3404706 RepID=UPI003CEB548F